MSFPVPQTPQKPLPGAFIQTPAPSSTYQPNLISQANDRSSVVVSQQQYGLQGQGQQRQQPGQVLGRSQQDSLKPIERASRTINETLTQESRYPEIDSYVSRKSTSLQLGSANTSTEGASSDYEISTQLGWAPFQKVKSYNIPDAIFSQYNNAQISTMMGLFANLNHAWVAIDNAFYLWDYTHPDPDLIGFEEQPHNITAVRLVTPRAGVFLPSITHLLVVATTADIILVGLASQAAQGGGHSVVLYSTRLSISIKGMSVNVIEGSATGRIFFAESANDDVYELTYQQEERWFQGRCAKINHTSKGVTAFNPGPIFGFGQKAKPEYIVQMATDDTRELLYTLSSRSTIRVFSTKSNMFVLVVTKPSSGISTDLQHLGNSQVELLRPPLSIISIDPIPAEEASRLHLMVTTSTGCRIFLSATSGSAYGAFSRAGSPSAPTSMQVQHIKFPPIDPARLPTEQQNSAQVIPYGNNPNLDNASKALIPTRKAVRYAPGYFFCFVARDQSTDLLFISAPETGRIARLRENPNLPRYPELGMWPHLGSRAEDIGLVSQRFEASKTPSGFGNELAVQYDKPASEVAILTNTGVHTFRRRRLVDIFASTIKIGGGDEGLEGEIKKFVRYYGPSETASTALAVACGQGLDVTSDARIAKITDPVVLEFARKAFIEHGGKPQINENQLMDQSGPTIDMVRPSARHEGLALYIARLLRSIWKVPIAKEGQSPTTGLSVTPTVSLGKLQNISQDLLALKEFLGSNKSFIDGLAGPDMIGRVSTKQEEVALQAEHRALHSLVVLVENIIEGIAFVQVLFEEHISEIISSLSNETRQQVRDLTFEGLFTTINGKDLAKELVKAIVNRNIANGSNVETVAEALRRRCGSFCSADDVVIFKAQELLKRSSEAGSESESGRNLLNESLRLFKEVAGSLTMEQLQWAAQNFTNMQFYAGAIQLALDVAHESDRGNRALAWIQEGRPAQVRGSESEVRSFANNVQDPREVAFGSRKRCYNLIHDVITSLEQASSQGPALVDGQYTAAARRRTEAYEVVETSEDEAFQTDLYDWYLSQGRRDRLLEIHSPYIVTYLQRKSVEDVANADLLWRYHTQNGHNHEAARVQLDLAQSNFPLSLDQRIEYLGRAKANASTSTPGVARQTRYQLLREVSDLLDVANIQSDLLQRLKLDPRISAQRRPEVLKELNGSMLPFDVVRSAILIHGVLAYKMTVV